MCQEKINQNVDYLYRRQIDETEHQNHRLAWILAAQAIIFAALCSVLYCDLKECVRTVLIWVGILISISGIYSVLISQTAIGTVYEYWHQYDMLSRKQKEQPMAHIISLVPTHFLRSMFRGFMFYTFAPNVFCAAWITLLLKYMGIMDCCQMVNDRGSYTCLYLIILVVVMIVSHVFGKLFLYKWAYEQYREKRNKTIEETTDNQDCNSHISDGKGMCRSVGNNENGVIFNSFNNYSGGCCNGTCPNVCHVGMIGGEPETTKCSTREKYHIYHIIVDRFNGGWTIPPKNENKFLGGHIKGIIDKLDYIRSQGYNAVMLTPIFTSDAYHGYHVTDYEMIDKHFGDWGDFDDLIKTAHQKGMKVICDYVPNHCHINHPFFQSAQNDVNSPYRSWFYYNKGRKGNFVFYQNVPDLPKFNLYNDGASAYLIGVAKMLAKKGVDGLRIDHVIGVPFTFLEKLRKEVKDINPDLFLFGEAWFDSMADLSQIEFIDMRQREKAYRKELTQEEIQLNYVGYLDGVLDFRFREMIVDEIENAKHQKVTCRLLGNKSLEAKIGSHFSKYPKDFQLILFLDNHDTNRFLFHCDGDKNLLQEGLTLCKNSYPYPHSVYYGTERFMMNKTDIFNGRPYADLDVREPMDWR